MKVKTFCVGLANEGTDGAFEILDRMVSDLGEITIHSVTDTPYEDRLLSRGKDFLDPRIVRVVVYTPANA